MHAKETAWDDSCDDYQKRRDYPTVTISKACWQHLYEAMKCVGRHDLAIDELQQAREAYAEATGWHLEEYT